MPHLECIDPRFDHWFIVDTPPSSPTMKPKCKSDRSTMTTTMTMTMTMTMSSLWTRLYNCKSLIRYR